MNLKYLTLGMLLSMSILYSCGKTKMEKNEETNYQYVWQDPDQQLEDRIEDLLSQMTLEEKVS